MYMCGLHGVGETTKAVVQRVEVKEALPQNEQKMERCKYIIYVCNRTMYVCMYERTVHDIIKFTCTPVHTGA